MSGFMNFAAADCTTDFAQAVFIRTCTEELLLFNEKGQRDLLASTMFKGPSRHPLFRWFRVIIETTGNKLACGSNVEAHSLL